MKATSVFLAALLVIAGLTFDTPSQVSAQTTTCKSSVGPGIPPPSQIPAGIAGFHAAWYGQSGYPTLCPGEKATSVVAYYNSGSLGWVQGQMGQAAYLGTWNWIPGQDMPSKLGGDGTNGTPNTGWPRYNRIAQQPAPYVGPGQVAWFAFTIQAPLMPGVYKLYLRPLVEGATWMEDYGVFWVVTVLNPDGTLPPPSPPDPPVGCSEWPMELGTMFAKLPLPDKLCLDRTSLAPSPGCATAGACFLARQTKIWFGFAKEGREVAVIGHEICHGHQYRVAVEAGGAWGNWADIWLLVKEGAEFQAAWDPRFGSTGLGPVEDFANVCSAWYTPQYYGAKVSDFPALYEFAKKWLPK